MTATLLSETEALPASRPAVGADLFDRVAGEDGNELSELVRVAKLVDLEPLWQRLEAHIAWRWGERAVVWIVEGRGEFVPRLTPATISATEVWQDSAWASVALDPSPLGGFCLPCEGPYRFTATVGSTDSPPKAVQEALRRLAFYVATTWDDPGAHPQDGQSASWPARALQNSGAADLLRPFRRA